MSGRLCLYTLLMVILVNKLLLIFLVCAASLTATTWHHPSTGSTQFIYAPGILECERAVARYCKSYSASTGQLVTCEHNFQVIDSNNCNSCNFAEIELESAHLDLAMLKHPWKLVSYAASKSLMYILKLRNGTDKISVTGESTNNLTVDSFGIAVDKINIGQQEDIALLDERYDQLVMQHPDTPIVLFGFSRGAATVFNFMATKYTHKDCKNVKAVVLEGCFDAMAHLFVHQMPLLKLIPRSSNVMHQLLGLTLPAYNKDAIAPIEVASLFPQDVPLLFVTSLKDEVVPINATRGLAYAVHNAGHEHVYLLELSHSTHTRYMIDCKLDAQLFESVAHAFYSQYGLSHDIQCANNGIQKLQAIQL